MGNLELIKKTRGIKIMEVCGTHTEVIAKYNLRELYRNNVKFISGPGCPVCVTSPREIDEVIEYAKKDIMITTFGDFLKVPGTNTSLAREKSQGANIKVVYSPLDALKLAQKHPDQEVLFIGIGFETTAPLIALTIMRAKKENVNNFSVLCLHKTMPTVLRNLLERGIFLDGLLLPGHVCSIIGSKPLEFVAKEFGLMGVISGFTPDDVIESTDIIIKNLGNSFLHIQYKRAVTPWGNKVAQKAMEEVFDPCDSRWRGFGIIKNSGLAIKDEWSFFDARKRFGPPKLNSRVNSPRNWERSCRCDDIIVGLITPPECSLFKESCTPDNPQGPCMVSGEGSCFIYYRYGG